MLAPDYLDTLPDALVELFQQVEDDILRDIARRINKMGGLTSTAAWQAWRLEQARAVHSDVVRTLAKYSGKADAEIRRILQDAGATALAADDTIYRVMGFAPSDISTNPALLNLLNAGYRQTLGSWKNLTRTTANTVTRQFEDALDRAWLQVSSGAFDYKTAVKRAVDDLASKGIKAGKVKVPVRDTEVAVADYSKTDGAGATHGDTSYIDVTVDKDKAVNEIIDGFDAAAVPDNLVADRLDSAAYSMALQIEKDATTVLEAQATTFGDTSALSPETIYGTIVDVRTAMSKAHIPNDNRRWLLVSPETYALILKSPEFVRATQLGDAVVQTGAQGRIAGFNVFEDTTLSETTDFIAGHPDWCTRVNEWGVNVHLQDLSGSGKYIGASAVQGRKIYAHAVTKKKVLQIKKHA